MLPNIKEPDWKPGSRLQPGVRSPLHVFRYHSQVLQRQSISCRPGRTHSPACATERPSDRRLLPRSLESPTDRADSYATYIRGILVPPETGNYRFAITSDDQSQFFLSTDSTPANAVKISEQTSWSGAKVYSSSTCTQSGLIPLVAGKHYYFEVSIMRDRWR
jgi:hypothetical protein